MINGFCEPCMSSNGNELKCYATVVKLVNETCEELVDEHKYARKTVGMPVDVKERYLKREDTSQEVVALLRELAHFLSHVSKRRISIFSTPAWSILRWKSRIRCLRNSSNSTGR